MTQKLVRLMLLTLATVFALYALLAAYLYVFQTRLAFLPNVPGRALTATPENIGLPFEDVRFDANDGVKVHAWFIPGAPGAATVLICHGNAGNISHRLDLLRLLHELGLGVLLFDYRGYGQSTGAPSESGTYRDARAAWNYLTEEKGVAPDRIILFGESLGGAVAAQLASEVTPGAVILASAFTSAPDLASHHYWYMPVRLLARIHFPTAAYLARVRAPVLIIHSRDDEIVPFSHGEELFRRAPEPKAFLEIRGDHNAGFLLSASTFTEGVRRFLLAHGLLGADGLETR